MKQSLFGPITVTNTLYEQNFFKKTLPSLLPEIDSEETGRQFNFCRGLFEKHPDPGNYHENLYDCK